MYRKLLVSCVFPPCFVLCPIYLQCYTYYEVPSSPQYSSLQLILVDVVVEAPMSVVFGNVRNVVGVDSMGLVTNGSSVLDGQGPNHVEVSATLVPWSGISCFHDIVSGFYTESTRRGVRDPHQSQSLQDDRVEGNWWRQAINPCIFLLVNHREQDGHTPM